MHEWTVFEFMPTPSRGYRQICPPPPPDTTLDNTSDALNPHTDHSIKSLLLPRKDMKQKISILLNITMSLGGLRGGCHNDERRPGKANWNLSPRVVMPGRIVSAQI